MKTETFDLYRVFVLDSERNRFFELLEHIRPDEGKVQRIDPSFGMYKIELVLSEEELVFLKLAGAFAGKEIWIQQWSKR
jgi:hypothetical protein